jgi:hypothetical protein
MGSQQEKAAFIKGSSRFEFKNEGGFRLLAKNLTGLGEEGKGQLGGEVSHREGGGPEQVEALAQGKSFQDGIGLMFEDEGSGGGSFDKVPCRSSGLG